MEKLIVVGDCRNGCDNKKGGEKQNSTLSFLENSALFLLILSSYWLCCLFSESQAALEDLASGWVVCLIQIRYHETSIYNDNKFCWPLLEPDLVYPVLAAYRLMGIK